MKICKRVLLALDLEGVNNVVGEPFLGLSPESPQWYVAREQAVLEINAAADALFKAGIEKIGLWDNHGKGENVDPEKLDPRIILIKPKHRPRMAFAKDQYDCICYFGYHTMEGTLGGVLAHTMNSKDYQFYKINGKYVGEVDMDAYLAAHYGMPSLFFAAGNIACKQAQRAVPDIVTVITKEELSRNSANFRDNNELLKDIRQNIVKAVLNSEKVGMKQMTFPCVVEKSFKRVENAAIYLEGLLKSGIDADYLDDEILIKDAHTVRSVIHSIEEFQICI